MFAAHHSRRSLHALGHTSYLASNLRWPASVSTSQHAIMCQIRCHVLHGLVTVCVVARGHLGSDATGMTSFLLAQGVAGPGPMPHLPVAYQR